MKKADNTDDLERKEPSPEPSDAPSLMQMIKEQVSEDDTPAGSNFSLRKIIGGEFLTAEIVRRQIWVVLLVALFLVIYIAEDYSYKKYIIEIDRLNTQLKAAKYRALSVESDLTEHTRESRIIELLHVNGDSLLERSALPPYIIDVPE
ncbi:MAG: hypothetical protein LUI08_00185 [Prevotella sp.]|nr:hypothetical protein [Prevotella sp.]